MAERLKIIGEVILGERGFFTVKKIAKKTGLSQPDVQTVLDRLFREGLILRFRLDPKFAPITSGRPKLNSFYQKPSGKAVAERIAPKLRENTALDRMWSIIRNKSKLDGRFTVRDVIMLAEVKRESARWFVKMLRRAGFIRPSKPGGPGVEWTLIKDPGPKRPHIQSSKLKAQS